MRDTANDLLNSTGEFLLDLGRILLIAIVYFVIAHFASKLIIYLMRNSRFLDKYGKDGEMIVFRMITIVAYGIASVALLTRIGFQTNGILTLLSALTVAIGLALQDVLKNFISGIFMLAERPFTVGDRVSVRNQEGTVQGIDIRTTMLRTDDGSLLMVPNSMMFTEILRNESRYNMRTVRFNITTTMPVDEIETKLTGIVERIEGLRPPTERPRLMETLDESMKWQVSFVVNQKQMARDLDISTALLTEFPGAKIERVVPV